MATELDFIESEINKRARDLQARLDSRAESIKRELEQELKERDRKIEELRAEIFALRYEVKKSLEDTMNEVKHVLRGGYISYFAAIVLMLAGAFVMVLGLFQSPTLLSFMTSFKFNFLVSSLVSIFMIVCGTVVAYLGVVVFMRKSL